MNLYSQGNGLALPNVYDPQVMTEDNSLETQLNKYPEISKKVIDLHSQFGVNWLMEKTGRTSGKGISKSDISDNAYRWKVRGHYFRPLYSANLSKIDGQAAVIGDLGAPAADLSTVDQEFAFGVKHNPANKEVATDVNPNDLLRFKSGAVAIALSSVIMTGAAPAQIAIVNCKLVSGTITVADLTADFVVGRIGNAFGEGSLGGYQNDTNEEWYINWTTTSRRGFNITGDAMTNVAWIVPNNGSGPLWYFEKINDEKRRFARSKELTAFYGRASMTTTGHAIMGKSGTNGLTIGGFNANNGGLTAPVIGDGLLAQIAGVNDATYDINTGLSDEFLVEYIGRLAQRTAKTSPQGLEWVVLAGTKGRIVLDRSFKKISGITAAGGGTMYDVDAGKDLSLGANFTTYHALGNKFTVMHYNVLDDPSIHSSSGGLTGTGDIIFLDFSMQDGVSNINMFNKKGRGHIEKYINGMHSLFGADLGKQASSGFDGAKLEMLCQSMIVMKNPLSSGILKASGDYQGVIASQANQTQKDWFAMT